MNLTRLFFIFFILVGETSFSQTELPNITVKTLSGDDFNIESLKEKENPIILSFWATWCGPCIKELNAINDMYIDWQDETGVELYAVSIDDARTVRRVKPMVNGNAWDYEVLIDENQDLKRRMNVINIPYVFIIYKGRIVYKHTSYTPGAENELYEEIKKL